MPLNIHRNGVFPSLTPESHRALVCSKAGLARNNMDWVLIPVHEVLSVLEKTAIYYRITASFYDSFLISLVKYF
jgi:hypothetical protein